MAKPKNSAKTVERRGLDRRIVDQTMALAADVGWDHLRLRRVAGDLGVSLAELQACHRDLDAVADAWFVRAQQAMLEPFEADFADLPARERVFLVMMRWFEANVEHRVVVGQMLRTKLYPSHPHHWVPLVFNLSRLIQWLREATRLDAPVSAACEKSGGSGDSREGLLSCCTWSAESVCSEPCHRCVCVCVRVVGI